MCVQYNQPSCMLLVKIKQRTPSTNNNLPLPMVTIPMGYSQPHIMHPPHCTTLQQLLPHTERLVAIDSHTSLQQILPHTDKVSANSQPYSSNAHILPTALLCNPTAKLRQSALTPTNVLIPPNVQCACYNHCRKGIKPMEHNSPNATDQASIALHLLCTCYLQTCTRFSHLKNCLICVLLN